MALKRMDNGGIMVEDTDAAIAFCSEPGLELEGRGPIEGAWAAGVTGLRDMRVEIAMLRTPDGHGRLELSRLLAPPAVADHRGAPVNDRGRRGSAGASQIASASPCPLTPNFQSQFPNPDPCSPGLLAPDQSLHVGLQLIKGDAALVARGDLAVAIDQEQPRLALQAPLLKGGHDLAVVVG